MFIRFLTRFECFSCHCHLLKLIWMFYEIVIHFLQGTFHSFLMPLSIYIIWNPCFIFQLVIVDENEHDLYILILVSGFVSVTYDITLGTVMTFDWNVTFASVTIAYHSSTAINQKRFDSRFSRFSVMGERETAYFRYTTTLNGLIRGIELDSIK